MEEIQQKQTVVEEQLQQSSSEAKREQEAVAEELRAITEKYETLQSKFEEMEANRQAEIAELRISKERVEEELSTFQSERDTLQTEKGALESSLGEIQQERQELAQQYEEVLGKLEMLQIRTDEYSKEEVALQQSVSQKAQQAQGESGDRDGYMLLFIIANNSFGFIMVLEQMQCFVLVIEAKVGFQHKRPNLALRNQESCSSNHVSGLIKDHKQKF